MKNFIINKSLSFSEFEDIILPCYNDLKASNTKEKIQSIRKMS